MRDSLRHFTAEFIGTFALVFIGSAAIMQTKNPGSGAGLLEVALAHAIILAVLVSATMRVSGHLNPAVTVGFLVTRRIEPMMAGLYLAEIEHFFHIYKDLEGKRVTILGWEKSGYAMETIMRSIALYEKTYFTPGT